MANLHTLPGIGGKRLSLSQLHGDVRHPAVGVIGRVLHTDFVGYGDDVVRVTIEIDEEKLPRG